jgi:mRNA interferase RelE/StbE
LSWRVGFEPTAAKELAALDNSVRVRVMKALARLAADPRRAANVKALESGGGVQRLRVGDWRVIYMLEDEQLLVLVIRVGHRREVYR